MSSNSSVALEIVQFQLASQYLSIVLGLILFVGGIVGNLMNIFTFSMLGNWKCNASSLYLLVKSIFDLCNMFFGLLTPLLSNGFKIDWTIKNQIWCKVRFSVGMMTFLCSLTFICFQSIDIYLCSSPSIRLREKSNVKLARSLILVCLFVWMSHMIPILIFYNIIQRGTTMVCAGSNTIYNQYITYFISICLYTIIPIVIICLFGYLAYRNIHRSNEHNRRLVSVILRQMMSMAFIQICSLFLFQIPLGIVLVYNIVTTTVNKDSYRQAQEQFVRTFAVLFTFGTTAVNHRDISSVFCFIVVLESILLVLFGIKKISSRSCRLFKKMFLITRTYSSNINVKVICCLFCYCIVSTFCHLIFNYLQS